MQQYAQDRVRDEAEACRHLEPLGRYAGKPYPGAAGMVPRGGGKRHPGPARLLQQAADVLTCAGGVTAVRTDSATEPPTAFHRLRLLLGSRSNRLRR